MVSFTFKKLPAAMVENPLLSKEKLSALDQYVSADDAFRSGVVHEADDATLLIYLAGLSNQPVRNETTRHRDIIRGLTINNILLKRHMEAIERRGATTQRTVIALTIAAVVFGLIQTIATVIQTSIALDGAATAHSKYEAQPQAKPPPESTPIPLKHSASDLPKQKKP